MSLLRCLCFCRCYNTCWAFKNLDSIKQCKREGFSHKMQEQKNEGCQVHRFLEGSKVAGNFHFALGKSFQQSHVHVHDLQSFELDNINMTHYIKHLSFRRDSPGIVNPLDGTDVTAHQGKNLCENVLNLTHLPSICSGQCGET
uniref:Endoplasmic reticulum-Golgi intermediate compartment protein n=1 Tax=Falco tinnunculus TaxID=100819 RepID=A0A8C4UA27_FALTI